MKKVICLILLLLAMSLVIGCTESSKKNSTNESTVISSEIATNAEEEEEEEEEETEIQSENEINKEVDESIMIEDTNTPTEDSSIEDNVSSVAPGNETYENISSHIFKVNDEYVMYTLNIRLIELFTEEGAATIEVDGEQYRLIFDVEQKIKDHTAKITDINGIDQTVEIMMK